MNKLFGLTFLATFLIASSDFYGYAWFGILAIVAIAPFTTLATLGQNK